MKITVAIPCYNLEDRISTCLESVITQDYKDVEILIIDDCSTDNSVDIIKGLIDRHPEGEFRFIINETNIGLNKVRNLAIDEAHGETLFFVDGDDTIEPGTLTQFHHRMEETQADVVCGSFRKRDFEGNTYIIKQFPEDTIKKDFAYISYIEKHINGYFNLGIWNNLYRLEFLRSHDIYCDTHYKIFEDRLFTFKVVLNARSVSYIHDITYNYFDVHHSICHQKEGDVFFQAYRAIIESAFETKYAFEKTHKIQCTPWGVYFLINYICLTDGLLKKYMTSGASDEEKKELIKWLREQYCKYSMNWSNIAGPYNKVSYLILKSPFPYAIFRYYFTHLQFIKKLFVLLNLSTKKL